MHVTQINIEGGGGRGDQYLCLCWAKTIDQGGEISKVRCSWNQAMKTGIKWNFRFRHQQKRQTTYLFFFLSLKLTFSARGFCGVLKKWWVPCLHFRSSHMQTFKLYYVQRGENKTSDYSDTLFNRQKLDLQKNRGKGYKSVDGSRKTKHHRERKQHVWKGSCQRVLWVRAVRLWDWSQPERLQHCGCCHPVLTPMSKCMSMQKHAGKRISINSQTDPMRALFLRAHSNMTHGSQGLSPLIYGCLIYRNIKCT